MNKRISLLLLFVTLVLSSPLLDMKIKTEQKYKLIESAETRSIDQSVKTTHLAIKRSEKRIVALNKKIDNVNDAIKNITKSLTGIEANITSTGAAVTTAEMKYESAKKAGSSQIEQYAKELKEFKQAWNEAKKNKEKIIIRKSELEARSKHLLAQGEQMRMGIQEMNKALHTFEAQKVELKTRLEEEKSEEIHHRRLYITAMEENKEISQEARKIEGKLGQLTGSERIKAHQRLQSIREITEKNERIIKLQKEFISIIVEKQKNLKGILRRMEQENKKHELTIKKEGRKMDRLKKQKKQWKTQKNGEKRINLIRREMDEIENLIDIENDRHGSQVDEFVRNIIYFRIEAIRKEIKALKGEKIVLKKFGKEMKGKRCSISTNVPQEIQEEMKKEQNKLKERIEKASNRIKAVKSRINSLKKYKIQLRKGLKKIIINRIKDARNMLIVQKKKVQVIKKIVKKLLQKNEKGKVQEEAERMKTKLERNKERMNTLRKIRDEAERDGRAVKMEEFREMREKQNDIKNTIRELEFNRKESNKQEQKNIALMALQPGNCYKRRHLWKKIKKIQEIRKEISKRIDKLSLKYIKITQNIKKEEEKSKQQLKEENQKLIEKKKNIIKIIKESQMKLKKQNNEKRYREELEKINELKDDIKSINERIINVRSEMRRNSAELLLRKYEEKYLIKHSLYKNSKEKMSERRREIAEISGKLIIEESIYEQTVFDKRKPIELKIQALKKLKEQKEKDINKLINIVKINEAKQIREAEKVIGFLKVTIEDTEKAKKEYMKIAGKKSTQYKAHYDRLAQVASNDILNMKKELHKYQEKIEEFNKKMIQFRSEKSPCKMCVELGRRAKESLALNMDNAELLRNIQDRCKYFTDDERGKCYSLAFKIAKYAANLFDPQELKIKKMCVMLKGCDTL
ncbi:intracellular protein transport protein USO1, putative [Entamoeba nuttalli P19]|uniref:Intracellular protein transport protein USO1, putative n=1 Tax=Entamoeba nuttalli (strain P19) TaxID=1076696 RepID=K2H708_ENTNP|nr:intracellular protein transport protein USO1, putative [Entamoeba nuttalli P19]EKE42342.1 intracellular protein transport protein USO1, putative [Entamoeba nuttalli P19]|eukprot:XP_008855323.1 intracellular protein transport protein USO1, putative [Entamoeba nuttalli P19]